MRKAFRTMHVTKKICLLRPYDLGELEILYKLFASVNS